MIVADTDVLIDFLAGQDPAAGRVVRELEAGTLWTTVITQLELLSGARDTRQVRVITELLDSIRIAALDLHAASRAALVRRSLERKGIGIGMADSLIAGISLHIGATLLTRNRRHFERVEGLNLASFE